MERPIPNWIPKVFCGWFLFLALCNLLPIWGFCSLFAQFQAAVIPGENEARLLQACTTTWDQRGFTYRYIFASILCLGVAVLLWKNPKSGLRVAQVYLLVGVLLRFMFNVFPRLGPEAGLFPIPPGTSSDPPVYLLPVTIGVITGTVQIFALTLAALNHPIPRKTERRPNINEG